MKKQKLSPNEVEALQRLAQGDTVADIADAWGKSPASVYQTVAQARNRLGARTTVQAVVRLLDRV